MGERLFGLVCAGLLLFTPAATFAQDNDKPVMLDTAVGLNAYQGLVEEHLGGVLNTLEVLASTDEAISGDWEKIKGPLEKLRKHVPTAAAVWFMKPDGAYFAVGKGSTGETLKDRAYYPTLKGGKDVQGSLVISKSTGERSIIVAAPIVRKGSIAGALGVSLSATEVAKKVSEQIGQQKNIIFYALDAQGQTALHSDPSLIFAFPSDIGDQSLKSAVATMLSKPQGVVNYTFRDVRRTANFQHSKATGLVFVLGIVHAN